MTDCYLFRALNSRSIIPVRLPPDGPNYVLPVGGLPQGPFTFTIVQDCEPDLVITVCNGGWPTPPAVVETCPAGTVALVPWVLPVSAPWIAEYAALYPPETTTVDQDAAPDLVALMSQALGAGAWPLGTLVTP